MNWGGGSTPPRQFQPWFEASTGRWNRWDFVTGFCDTDKTKLYVFYCASLIVNLMRFVIILIQFLRMYVCYTYYVLYVCT